MARDWHDLFITGEERAAAPAESDERKRGFFRRLRQNLSKTRQALGAELQATMFQTLDDETWERLEETLIYADVGATTTARIVERLETEAGSGEPASRGDLTRRLPGLPAAAGRAGGGKNGLPPPPAG